MESTLFGALQNLEKENTKGEAKFTQEKVLLKEQINKKVLPLSVTTSFSLSFQRKCK